MVSVLKQLFLHVQTHLKHFWFMCLCVLTFIFIFFISIILSHFLGDICAHNICLEHPDLCFSFKILHLFLPLARKNLHKKLHSERSRCFSSSSWSLEKRYTADFSFALNVTLWTTNFSCTTPSVIWTHGVTTLNLSSCRNDSRVSHWFLSVLSLSSLPNSPLVKSPSLTRDVPVNRTWRPGSRPAGHNGRGQVRQLFAVIWKWSPWVVNTVVTSRSTRAHAPTLSAPDHAQWSRDARYCQTGLRVVQVKCWSSLQIKNYLDFETIIWTYCLSIYLCVACSDLPHFQLRLQHGSLDVCFAIVPSVGLLLS